MVTTVLECPGMSWNLKSVLESPEMSWNFDLVLECPGIFLFELFWGRTALDMTFPDF